MGAKQAPAVQVLGHEGVFDKTNDRGLFEFVHNAQYGVERAVVVEVVVDFEVGGKDLLGRTGLGKNAVVTAGVHFEDVIPFGDGTLKFFGKIFG